MAKWVYSFGDGAAEGRAEMKNLLGGKGAGLAEMSNLGLPVPPGFTITTEVCTYFYEHQKSYPKDLAAQVAAALGKLETTIGARFGDTDNPLLVSVRSGARASMPGMMDTVLNLGLNDTTVEGLSRRSGDARFAYDSYRRFIQMYGQVVLGVEHHHFEELLDNHKLENGASLDTDLSAADWQTIIAGYKDVVAHAIGKPFPQEPQEQSRRWCSATWARIARPASPSPATPRPAPTSSMASISSMRRARTSSPASAPPSISPLPASRPTNRLCRRWKRSCPPSSPSCRRCAPRSRSTTATCRTSSSPCSRASCGCCRRAPASAPPRRRSRSPSRWSRKASSTRPRRCAASSPPRSTSSSIPCSIPRPRRRCWRAVCRPRPAPPRGPSCSRPTRRSGVPGSARMSSWCASRPAPRTSTACMRHAAS